MCQRWSGGFGSNLLRLLGSCGIPALGRMGGLGWSFRRPIFLVKEPSEVVDSLVEIIRIFYTSTSAYYSDLVLHLHV
jgi:hypothetical protein